jgi:NADPH2:quinone reductase
MYAIRQHTFGGPEVLQLEELPTPRPAAGEVLIVVTAACINHYDILSRRGISPGMPLPRIPGIDCTGVVLENASARADLPPGTPVVILGERMGNGGPGAYASHVCIDAEEVFPIPHGADPVAVACLGISYLTARYALCGGARTGRPQPAPGDTLLIQGVGGGVASAALQIACARGIRVIATTSSAAKARAARDLGAVAVVDYSTDDPVAGVRAAATALGEADGVDFVLNAVGGATVRQGLDCLRHGGTLLTIGTAYGRELTLDGYDFLCRELRLCGVNISFHTPHERYALLTDLCADIAAGRLAVLIDQRFPLAAAAAAHRHVEAHQHFGKVVLVP